MEARNESIHPEDPSHFGKSEGKTSTASDSAGHSPHDHQAGGV